MSSTQDINSFNDELTQINALKQDFADIRRKLEELRLKIGKRKGNQDLDNEKNNSLLASDGDYIYDGNLNSELKNVWSESDADSDLDSDVESGVDSDAGSGNNTTMNVLPLQNQFDPTIEYTHEKIEGFRDLAKNTSDTKELNAEEKYNIIINAQKRLNYLKDYLNKNKNSPEYKKLNNEYNELNNIFNKCNNPLDKTSDNHCLKIKDNWKGIQERHKMNQIIQPSTRQSSQPPSQELSPLSSQHSTPRKQVTNNIFVRPRSAGPGWKGGIKTRKTRHRKTKKSKSHKKRH